jgi:putative transposase
MIDLEDRQAIADSIFEAHEAGARLGPACEIAGINVRTLQRWTNEAGQIKADARPAAIRSVPANALSAEERAAVLAIANEDRFAALSPAQIVPALADEGRYVASESTFHRILKADGQNTHRGRAKEPRPKRPPTTHTATSPTQVWCWDLTYLPTWVKGKWYYLYMILDLFSRKIVGWEVHEEDDGQHAAMLAKRTALSEGIAAIGCKPVLHGDNGPTLKANTVVSMLAWLGISRSYSRPRVSDDNAYIESLFRTVKYRHGFPKKGFADLDSARQWVTQFVRWYNHEHLHSRIQYVTPAQRHLGQDNVILAARDAVYRIARAKKPLRWSGQTRNWTPISAVTLNPEKDDVVAQAVNGKLMALSA